MEFLKISYTNGFAILDLCMWVIALITISYLISISGFIHKMVVKYQKSYLGKYLFYYSCKFKSKDKDFENHMISMWEAGFLLDKHIRKIVTIEKYNELILRRSKLQSVLNEMKTK